MPTFIMALLIVAALGLLASSWLSGRRGRDPSSSVDHFHRAMSAMQNATPRTPGRPAADDPDSHDDATSPDDLAGRT